MNVIKATGGISPVNKVPMINDLLYRVFDRFLRGYENFKVRRMKRSFKSCGERVYISPKCFIWSEDCLEVGNDVCIHAFTYIFAVGGVKIGNGAMISSNCSITTTTHPTDSTKRFAEDGITKPVIIGKNAWLGMGAVVLPGITIGDDSIVGAGSVVTKDVPPKSIVVGNPAKVLRKIEL